MESEAAFGMYIHVNLGWTVVCGHCQLCASNRTETMSILNLGDRCQMVVSWDYRTPGQSPNHYSWSDLQIK